MAVMSTSSLDTGRARAFSRRTLLAAALAGTAAVAAGCTGGAGDQDPADRVTADQVDQLAGQVAVQAALVAAFDRAFAASPDLAAGAGVLAEQARQQLDRLTAAAPGSAPSPAPSSGSTPAGPPMDPDTAREHLRGEVAAAADSHARACPDFTGARAALLGSIAAGLRGQDGLLA